MSIFTLTNEIIFPPVELSDENGLLAVGGDLSAERLLEAYSNGIFPWYSDDDPIVWWSPDPRFVLIPDEIKISKSMKQVLRRETYEITYDKSFSNVILECSKPRRKQCGTWITDEMHDAYIRLNELGFAHSVEAWKDGELAGGLYGISLGRCFFGESMFTKISNASKTALVALCRKLQELNFQVIDCQVYTGHLEALGAKMIPRSEFIEIINNGLVHDTYKGNWALMEEFKS